MEYDLLKTKNWTQPSKLDTRTVRTRPKERKGCFNMHSGGLVYVRSSRHSFIDACSYSASYFTHKYIIPGRGAKESTYRINHYLSTHTNILRVAKYIENETSGGRQSWSHPPTIVGLSSFEDNFTSDMQVPRVWTMERHSLNCGQTGRFHGSALSKATFECLKRK